MTMKLSAYEHYYTPARADEEKERQRPAACANCGSAIEESGCGCAVSPGHGELYTYEIDRYDAGVGWDSYICDMTLAYMRGESWDDACGDAGQLTWDEYQGVLRRTDMGSHAWRACRSDGKVMLRVGSAYDAEHGAWLSRCPR